METNYTSNSFKSKKETKTPEKKHIQKVVNGKVIKKKPTGVRKLADIFRPDDMENVKQQILEDVIVPKIKDIMLDAFTTVLYGKTRKGHGGYGIPATRTSYGNYYNGSPRESNTSRRKTRNYMDIILSDRGEAEAVLDGLDGIMSEYGMVSISDFYELVGETGEYTDNDYGWFDLRSAATVRVPEGYLIKLPKAVPLK